MDFGSVYAAGDSESRPIRCGWSVSLTVEYHILINFPLMFGESLFNTIPLLEADGCVANSGLCIVLDLDAALGTSPALGAR
jgi:hypothetical protein